jgi:hypothetical protein
MQSVSANRPALVLAIYRHAELPEPGNVAVDGFWMHFHSVERGDFICRDSVRGVCDCFADCLESLQSWSGRAPNKSPERNARWRWLVIREDRWFFHIVGRAWLSFLR